VLNRAATVTLGPRRSPDRGMAQRGFGSADVVGFGGGDPGAVPARPGRRIVPAPPTGSIL